MRVAILMSSYNGEKYISKQIDSILSQKGNFQMDIIVRDDGSKDDTIHILEEYERNNRITLLKGENLGPAKSFMQLVLQTSGYDFYAFADQDDFWYPAKIEKGINELKKLEDIYAIFFSNAELVDENLDYLGRMVYKKRPPANFESVICGAGIQGCTMIWNEKFSALIRKAGMPDIVTMHDSYLARTCLAIGGCLIYSDEVLIKYRQHSSNVIGIPTNMYTTFLHRIKDIVTPDKISIACQAQEIKERYKGYIDDEKLEFLERVIKYKQSLYRRIQMAMDKRTKYVTTNISVKMRIKILLGNR